MQKPNIRTIIIASVSLLLPAMALQAQNLSISGVVTDETGSPVIGAGVIVKGTTVGAATDIDGKFALSDVPADGTLTVSSIGYDPLEIEVNGKTSFNITLYTDSEMLEEVIMVGYGTQKKSDVTGSISSVTAESMENRSVSDVGQALQGKVAGLQILSTSGAPGASTSFRIRGYSSNGSSEPLYIVDGLKVTSIDYLDTESIDQIEVLKDAASAAIYGAEAGNGVVIISTKTAKNGDGRLFYNFQHSWQNIAGFPDVMNAEEYLEYQDLIGNTSVRSNWDGVTDTNWADEIFETGLMTRHTLGFQGGNDKASLFVSLSYNSHDGIVISDKDTFKRLTGQINASYKIKKWLQVQSNVSFEKAATKMVRHSSESGSAISSVLMHDPITPVVFDMDNLPAVVASRYEEGKPYLTDAAGNIYGVSLVCESQNYNPLIDIAQSDDRSERVNVNGTLQAMLTPFKNFIFTSRLGYRIGSVYESSYLYPFYVNELRSQSSEYLSGGSRQSLFYQWENFANYSFSLGNHEFALMAGMSYEEFNMKTIGADTYSLQSTEPNFRYLDYSTTDANDSVSGIENTNRSMSYFGRIGWSYKDRYNIMVNFRADAFDSSKLSRDSRWGFFPSVSGSWNVSNEPFFQQMDQNVLSFMKLRLSYGINGNVNALNSYAYASSMSTGNNYNLDGETLITGIYPGTVLANPGLKWEESRQVDAGIDLRMFDDKLSFTMDFYRKTTDGLLVSTTPALSSGCSTVWKNAGQVLNKGFDGNHFITGLSSHLRDLLVSKDPVTLPLLEVGASIRERYQQQAQQCPLPFLYRAMKLCNDCDLNYRVSKNKRLLVELTLIQLAQLTASDAEEPGGGRSPRQTLKPITPTPSAAAPQAAQPVESASQPQAVKPASSRQTRPTAPAVSLSTTASALKAQAQEEKKVPVVKQGGGGLGISIKRPYAAMEEKAANVQEAPVAVAASASHEENRVFNEHDINLCWQEYAGHLPKEQIAIAKRMQNMHLAPLEGTVYEAVVENDFVAKEFANLLPDLQNYLRKRLNNTQAELRIRVSAPNEKVRAYGRVERFQMMAQKNSALLKLKDQFGLELYS